MSNRDSILNYIKLHPDKDDDQISKELGIRPRQTVNQVCRSLRDDGSIERFVGSNGKVVNHIAFDDRIPAVVKSQRTHPQTPASFRDDWFWEGNVTDALKKYFACSGWTIVSMADTETKQRGIDLHVRKGERGLLIEAKGYPSTNYRDPGKASQTKKTKPAVQARHWFAHAIHTSMILRQKYPSHLIAIGLPDFPRYRDLYADVELSLRKLSIAMLFVQEDGVVEAIEFNI